jgi:hypothetical protein
LVLYSPFTNLYTIGSVHVHMILWCKECPDVMELIEHEEGQETILSYVNEHVCTKIPLVSEFSKKELERSTVGKAHPSKAFAELVSASSQAGRLDTFRLCKAVQMHSCNTINSKCKRNKKRRCPFPKECVEKSKIMVQTSKGDTMQVKFTTERNNGFVNNFHAILLRSWRANMDIQVIGNRHGVAHYVCKYIAKSETETEHFRRLIRTKLLDSNHNALNGNEGEIRRMFSRIGMALIGSRDVSAQEATTILLGLPLKEMSRVVQRVRTIPVKKRNAVVMAEGNVIPAGISKMEKSYLKRDLNLEDMCLERFAAEHTENGKIRLKEKHAVVQWSHWYRHDVENADYRFSILHMRKPWREMRTDTVDTQNEFLEFFRDNDDEKVRIDNRLRMDEILIALAEQREADEKKNKHLDEHGIGPNEMADQLYENSLHSDQEDSPDLYFNAEESAQQESEDIIRANMSSFEDVCNDVEGYGKMDSAFEDAQNYFSKDNLESGREERDTAELKSFRHPIFSEEEKYADQERIYARWHMHYKAKSEGKTVAPLKMVVIGPAGCGKSYVIREVLKMLKHYVSSNPTHFLHKSPYRSESNRVNSSKVVSMRNLVLVIAHQGVAAYNIGGETICSALKFGINTIFSQEYVPLERGADAFADLEKRLQNTSLLVIDEMSMVSCEMLAFIDKRLRQIRCRPDEPFGGVDVILAGDLAQLDPAGAGANALHVDVDHNTALGEYGRTIFQSFTEAVMMVSQHRVKDAILKDILTRMNKNECTQADVDVFNNECYIPNVMDQTKWFDARILAYTNKLVDQYNVKRSTQYENAVTRIFAQHEVYKKGATRDEIARHRQSNLKCAFKRDAQRDARYPRYLILGKGSRVRVTANICVSYGIANGTTGTVVRMFYRKPRAGAFFNPVPHNMDIQKIVKCEDNFELPVVLIKLDKHQEYKGPRFHGEEHGVVPIFARSSDVVTIQGVHRFKIRRTMIPLASADAFTVHRSQGESLKQIIVNSIGFTARMTYVALSRASCRENIALLEKLTLDKCTVNMRSKLKRDRHKIATIKSRLVTEAFLRTYSDELHAKFETHKTAYRLQRDLENAIIATK